jgi:hypothetical protein
MNETAMACVRRRASPPPPSPRGGEAEPGIRKHDAEKVWRSAAETRAPIWPASGSGPAPKACPRMAKVGSVALADLLRSSG